jgi:hypothetical protein
VTEAFATVSSRSMALNCDDIEWPGPGSNRRPSAFQADARTN